MAANVPAYLDSHVGRDGADQHLGGGHLLGQAVAVQAAEPGRRADAGSEVHQPGGLVRIARDDGDAGDAVFGQRHDGRRRGAARPAHQRAPRHRHPARPPRRRRRCCRRASRAGCAPGCWPTRPVRRAACARRRTAGRRTCRAWSPTPRPTAARTRRPPPAAPRRRTRCARRSSRAGRARGRRPGAVAGNGNGRPASPEPRLLPSGRCRGHRCAWPARCSPNAVDSPW